MLRRYWLPRYAEARSRGLLKTIDEFLRSQYYSKAELINMQEAKLQKLISFAYEEVPYYRDKLDGLRLAPSDFRRVEDLQKLPVLTKRDIRDLRRVTPRNGRAHTIVRRTSGSTGTPSKIVVEREATIVEEALFYRFLLSIGYEWGDRVIQPWGASIVRPESLKEWIVESVRSAARSKIWNIKRFDTYKLDPKAMREILRLIADDTPQIVRCYAASLYSIALEITRRGVVDVNVKAVTATAERLFDYQRRAIETAFRQKVYDQYGCGESNSIAFECEAHGGLHVASEHVILELLGDENEAVARESGRVTITDLDNYAMPLIRYQNGDLAKWSSIRCPCGRNLPFLERVEGRLADMLDLPGDKRIHGGFFDQIYVELGFGEKYLIGDLRVVQEDMSHYRLEFVMDGRLKEDDVKALKAKYREYVGDVSLEIAYVDEIPVTESGKRVFVVPSR